MMKQLSHMPCTFQSFTSYDSHMGWDFNMDLRGACTYSWRLVLCGTDPSVLMGQTQLKD